MSQHHSIVDIFPQCDERGFFSETPTETSGYTNPKGKPPIDHSTKTYIPEPWLSGGPSRYGVPKKGNPWEKCFKKIKDYDKNMCDGWREEVDNLLIFAGLFSSVLTAFVIESYHGLQQDPNEKNTFYLEQLLIQARNGNAQSTPIPSLPPFSPSSTNIRVNVFWFTSLSLSLSTVLLGLLCMQWLREYQRKTPLDPQDAISLRQLRYEGLIAWKVPDILMLLPVLLHLSLLLFFLGLIDLLWSLNHIVAFFVSVVASLVWAFLLATTFLPALQLLSVSDNSLRGLQCPYKSPQSWAFHRIVLRIVWSFSPRPRLGTQPSLWFVRYKRFIEDKNWVDHDMRWHEARSMAHTKDATDDSRRDVVQGLAWIGRNLGQTADTVYAIYHCIRDLSSTFSRQVVSQISEKTKGYLSSEKMVTYLGTTKETERREIMAALFLEINNRAYPQLDQYQVESVVRILNTRLQVKEDHDIPISESFPFVNWPMHIRTLPADLISQFLLCVKHLVERKQLPPEQEDDTWIMIQRFLSSPSTRREDHSAHHQHAHLALEIIDAFENNLPTIRKSDANDQNVLDDARKKVKECVRRIIRVLSPGELGDLEPRARRIVSAIRSRMDSLGGLDSDLQIEDQKRWDRMVKGVSGDEK